jgi:hypothetical protein
VFRTVGTGKHKTTKELCTVLVLAPGSSVVSVEVSRGGTLYATGAGRMKSASSRIRLHLLRAIPKARYLVTVEIRSGPKVHVLEYTKTL